jgi:hypothetical protein
MMMCWVATELHKTLDEVRAMTVVDFDAVCAFLRIKNRPKK